MTLNQVKRYYGTVAKTAEACGTSYQVAQKWYLSGVLPMGRQCQLEILTGGKLRADRKKWNLRSAT